MDIEYFLNQRTSFVRYYYDNAALPFMNIIEAIDKGIEPYVPPYSEDPEPPFLKEWLDAQTALDMVGQTALSMLSSSVHLFLNEWVRQIENNHGVEITVNFKKPGGLLECNEIFSKLGLKPKECESNLKVIEQILLARNRAQHPEQLTSMRIEYTKKDLDKYPKPFFARQSELDLCSEDEDINSWLLSPAVTPTKENIYEAISQVELFCSWLDTEYWKGKNA